MNAARRLPLLPLPLVIVGVGLLVAGLRPGQAGPAASGATPLAYAPPAVASVVASHTPVRVVPVRQRPAHTARPRRVVTSRRSEGRPAFAPASEPAPVGTRAPSLTSKPVVTHAAATSAGGPTAWAALDAAIARIPTYRSGAARWVVSTKYDFWGTADWYHDVLYVDPSVPVDKLYDVAVHEWSHELSVLDYGGDVAAATRAMNATFGGSGLTGPERAADCMAILQGAGWTHYTTCTNQTWRAAAARLVAGRTLL